MKLSINILLIALVLLSCGSSSEHEPEIDIIPPEIIIVSPNINTIIEAGENIKINVNLSDNDALDSYVISIDYVGTKSLKSVEEYSYNSHTDTNVPKISGNSAYLNYNVSISEKAKPGNYKFEIEAKDLSDNETSKEVMFEII